MRDNVQKRNGFTLIEILIVMAIVALLLTIALPRYFGSLERSKDVALQENLKVLRLSLDRFYVDKGRYPQVLEELVEQKYLRAVPVDPITESADTWVLIPARNEEEEEGIGDVKSGAPGTTKDGRSYGEL
ncbi:MAG: type II secretion system GspH family protein [Zoogloeaceae bacterium]|jgi:prepilin-type N-terminal cleavage/methylation domain-containing protein|nr:type II secretion system GspH family protein [Zoogloeaceae bacterium]